MGYRERGLFIHERELSSRHCGVESITTELMPAFPHCSGGLWSCEKIGIGRFPSLHHRKEGWPSDQKMIAKPPLTARPGWFSDENKWKTTPAASASVAGRNFLDDAATPPCGRARRGITLDSNLFTAPMTAATVPLW